MSEFKNMKFRVSSKEESEIVQKLLFEMGYKWWRSGRQLLNNDERFLYTDDDGDITFGVCETWFTESASKEYSLKCSYTLAPKITKTITIAGKKYDEELVKCLLENNSVPCIEEDDE